MDDIENLMFDPYKCTICGEISMEEEPLNKQLELYDEGTQNYIQHHICNKCFTDVLDYIKVLESN